MYNIVIGIVFHCLVFFSMLQAAAEREIIIDPMTEMLTWELGGHRIYYLLGNAKLERTVKIRRKDVPSSLALKYDFTHPERRYFSLVYKGGHIPGRCKNFSFWVYGDASGHRLGVLIEDAERRYYKKDLCEVNFKGWQKITVPVGTGKGWEQWARVGEPCVPPTFPITVRQICLDRNRESKIKTGEIYFHDLRACSVISLLNEVKLSLTTGRVGNIFYIGEQVVVKAQFTNPTKQNVTGTLVTILTDFFGEQKQQEHGTLHLPAGKSTERNLVLVPWGIGWYRVDVVLKNETGERREFIELGINTPAKYPGLQPQSRFGMVVFPTAEQPVERLYKFLQEAGVKWIRSG